MTAHCVDLTGSMATVHRPYGRRPRVSKIHVLPHSFTTGTAFRLHRQHRLQKQTGCRTKPGTFLSDQHRRVRPDQRQPARFPETSLQKPVANLRKPYGTAIQEIRRYASFIGTSNQKDLLTDPSGSRRFICIEVTGPINTNVTINYRQLYAQAMTAISQGERYWLDDTDEAILKQSNQEFEQPTPLEQLFLCHFQAAQTEDEGTWMTPMEILSFLQKKTKDRLAINKVAYFGRALRKLGISSRRRNRGTEYHVIINETAFQ